MAFYNTDVAQLHDDLVNKRVSATELTKAAFKQIKATDDDVKAFWRLTKKPLWTKPLSLIKQGLTLTNH